ncbi:MAG: hypothetical protein GY869_20785 [Planctomycetes bacterium]|nr:hypothetical protein [Planctomycetota bacterium]
MTISDEEFITSEPAGVKARIINAIRIDFSDHVVPGVGGILGESWGRPLLIKGESWGRPLLINFGVTIYWKYIKNRKNTGGRLIK